jgi:GT2 family glycosyltransferase
MAFDAVQGTRPLWAGFDADWYKRSYSADLTDIEQTPASLEAFYHGSGVRLRHSPNRYFDERWYLATYPDVAAAVSQGTFVSGFEHYGLNGHAARSPHWLFHERFYRSENADLTADALKAGVYANGYDHYLRTGDREFRSGHWLFNPAMHRMATASAANETPRTGEFSRFLSGDRSVGSTHRLSWYFDPVWYLAAYPEVGREIKEGLWSCALEHYLCNKRPADFDPNADFSEAFYRSTNPDVARLVGEGRSRNGFEHFLRYGAAERRKPHPEVDLQNYFRAVSVQSEIEQGHFADAFAHFEAKGGRQRKSAVETQISEADGKRLYAITCENMIPGLVRHPIDFTCTQPTLSVIVVAHNRFTFTLATLASLRANYPGAMQVILVDSGSRDAVARIETIVKGLDVIRFRYNIGFVEGCNAGLERVRAEATLFLNNDVLLNPGAVQNAMARLWATESAGAVGGKVIRPHGLLQEAGSIVWRDGWISGYLRDQDPNVPEANFVRAVDYCSAVFLLCKTEVLRQLKGFDTDYSPAYFEEADLCLRMRKIGFSTIYDPAVSLQHYEFATGDHADAHRLMERNHPTFRRKNAEQLRRQSFNQPSLVTAARAIAPGQRRILFIEDRLPFRYLGSGFTRSNDIIHAMDALGYHVTVYPIYKATETVGEIYRAFPDTVEVIFDREMPDLEEFVAARSNYYDAVWIARTHNAQRLAPLLARAAAHLPTHRVVLDTEAVAAARTVERNKVVGGPPDGSAALGLREMVEAELSCAFVSQRVVAVSELDAALIRDAGIADVEILGHMQSAEPSPRGWEPRSGLLFFASIMDANSPNLDALGWFSAKVLPILDRELPPDVVFGVGGYLGKRVDLSLLRRNPRVKMLGTITDLNALYGRFRLLIAPTRFAGGIPYKVHEAAAHGLPVVASPLLCRQVGWEPGKAIVSISIDDPQACAASIIEIYNDEEMWSAIQANALSRVREENGRDMYLDKLAGILARVFE